MNSELLNNLNTIVSLATPLVIASLGETITERAGVINLSVDGSLVLAAMAGFAGSIISGSLVIGFMVGMLVGAIMALIIAFSSITLRLDQVAIGFVLTLLGADLAEFVGVDFAGEVGNSVPFVGIPLLQDIPILGPVFFDHNAIVYVGFILVFVVWFWLFRTRGGLEHRAIGERPEAAYARGARVNQKRYLYTIIGGLLIGFAGASYSLAFKPGWFTPPPMRGDGWIALAIVIFGGWHPFRVVLGAYLFTALTVLAGAAQGAGWGIPKEALNALPWVLMIVTLLMVSSGAIERILQVMPKPVQKRMRSFLRSDPPKAIGTRFEG